MVNFVHPRKEPVRVKRSDAARGVRWRSAEERREARRKIAAIRRENEARRLEAIRVDTTVLRSPKAIVGMLAVLVIVGLAVVSAADRPAPAKADPTPALQARARRSVEAVAEALTLFRVHTGGWPPQRLGLFALAKDYRIPGWKGPYINWAYLDPWENAYVYRMPRTPFEAPEVFSCGPDGRPDTNDDIRAAPEDFHCAEGSWRRPEPTEPEPAEATP